MPLVSTITSHGYARLCNSLSEGLSVSHTACWEMWGEHGSLVEKWYSEETGVLTRELKSTPAHAYICVKTSCFSWWCRKNTVTVEELMGMLAKINKGSQRQITILFLVVFKNSPPSAACLISRVTVAKVLY